MGDVIVSQEEGRVYHELWCPYVNRIRKKKKKQMDESTAIRKGYRECKFCRSVRGIAYKYRNSSDMHVVYDSVDNALCVRTDVGFWKLLWREESQNWHLYHQNHRGWKSFDSNLPDKELMRGSFHRQVDVAPTIGIGKVLTYIRSHDKNYKIAETDIRQMKKRTPKQRDHYRRQKARKKRESVKNVYRIFDEIERSKS